MGKEWGVIYNSSKTVNATNTKLSNFLTYYDLKDYLEDFFAIHHS